MWFKDIKPVPVYITFYYFLMFCFSYIDTYHRDFVLLFIFNVVIFFYYIEEFSTLREYITFRSILLCYVVHIQKKGSVSRKLSEHKIKYLPCNSSVLSILSPCCATFANPMAYSLSHFAFCCIDRFMISMRRNSASCRDTVLIYFIIFFL